MTNFGELTPVGGGDPIPLLKKNLLVGRRESCDIVLRFPNVSAHHCQLSVDSGYWYVQDLESRNGTKVNGVRVNRKRIDPGDTLAIAKHKYVLEYTPIELGAVGPPPPNDDFSDEILGRGLLDRAGIGKSKARGAEDRDMVRRYDPSNNAAGQIRKPSDPV